MTSEKTDKISFKCPKCKSKVDHSIEQVRPLIFEMELVCPKCHQVIPNPLGNRELALKRSGRGALTGRSIINWIYVIVFAAASLYMLYLCFTMPSIYTVFLEVLLCAVTIFTLYGAISYRNEQKAKQDELYSESLERLKNKDYLDLLISNNIKIPQAIFLKRDSEQESSRKTGSDQNSVSSQKTNYNYCPYCGFKIPPGANFCPSCGKRL